MASAPSRSSAARAGSRAGSRARRPEPVAAASVERMPGGRRARARLLVPWLTVVVAAVAVLVVDRTGPALPSRAPDVAAVVLSAAYAAALAHRVRGRALAAAVVAAALGAAAQTTGEEVLLGGAAALTAFVAATLAVVVTEPARTARAAVLETVQAALVAAGGALAVPAYDAAADPVRLRLVALGAALVAVLALASRLGPGLAGLGTLARAVLVVALVVAVGAVAYGEALGRWGSAGLIDTVADTRRTLQDLVYAVPVPLPALLGFPALVYGTWLRGRARQGWWVCALGVGATAPVAVALTDPRLDASHAALGLGYSGVIGVVVGLVVVLGDRRLTHT